MGRKTKDSGIDGLLVVDKPAGWTSHDVVAKCRGVFGQRRAGHSGTLDPDATGVLLIGFGRVTKALSYLTELPKTYVGEVVLGTETSTLDSSGEVVRVHTMSPIGIDAFRAAAHSFVGEILQVPPMVSALSIDGVRLHELARQGIEVERKARPVTIHALRVLEEPSPMVFRIEVTCSSGTYIRTLAADIGTALGGGAHLQHLRRTAIGSFLATEGVTLDEHLASRPLLSPAEALRDYPHVDVGSAVAAMVRNGKVLDLEQLGLTSLVGPVVVRDASDQVLAIYEPHRGAAKPAVVLAREGG